MRILITGGAGFVGSQLGVHLARLGHEVLLLDNMRYGHVDNLIHEGRPYGRFIGRDVRDAGIARFFDGVDAVVHLAGIAALPDCQKDPVEAYDVNVGGTANVLECARRAGVRRFIFSSTSAIYENTTSERQREDDPVQPDLVYSMTKHAAEQLCTAAARNYGLDIITCRFFNLYGPHQDFLRTSPPFTSYVARELALGRKPVLFNDSPAARRDYVYIDDLLALLVRMLESPSTYHGNIFNVGSGTAYSVPEIFGVLQQVAGSDVTPEYQDPEQYWNAHPALFEGPMSLSRARIRKEVFKSSCADTTLTTTTFGWNPTVPLAEGLARVYAYSAARLRCS